MLPAFIDRNSIPHKPGVYKFKDYRNRIIYVGKALDLSNRVKSYFSSKTHEPKTAALVSNVKSLETIVVESELEALILEANLIKKYLPEYNIRLTDDKDYLYIKVTKEPFPKIITARKKELSDSLKFFGPFPSSRTVHDTLKSLRRVFPWCQIGGSSKTGRPCFYFHLGLCPGPCARVINQKDYRKIINHFSAFMEGKKAQLSGELTKEMEEASKDKRFEDALRLKKMLSGLNYLTQPNQVQSYLENPNFLEDQHQKSVEELQKELGLLELPSRIECYDISNISGKDATGSMVVLTDGEIDKSQYRKFKIRIAGKPNDYAMHAEVARRRLNHPDWGIPQLILIDGGRGQVRAVKNEIDRQAQKKNSAKLFEKITIYGIAKREEWLYPPEGEIIKLPKRSLALRLVQKIRDESHRFAVNYHRKLHRKSSLYGSRLQP